MSDPLDELRNLSHLGGDVTPLPPAEVRRRGDIRRRRTNALAAVGGVAAIALIATPIAVIASGNDRSAPMPLITPDRSYVTTIPDDFPLTMGYPETNENLSAVQVGKDDLLADIAYCGVNAFPATPKQDLASVKFIGAEDYRSRVLSVYADEAEAEGVVDQFRATLTSCPEEPLGESRQVYTVVPVDAGDDALAMVHTSEQPGVPAGFGGSVIEVIRVGNAVLVATASGEGNGPGSGAAADEAQPLVDYTAPLVGKLCVFAAGGCAPATTPVVPSSDDIPSDFPLDVDHSDMTGDGGEITGPSPDFAPVADDEICASPVWGIEGQDSLGFSSTGPEYEDARELRTYATADDAVAEMAELRSGVMGCDREQLESGWRIWTTYPAETGYDSFAFGSTYDQGLGGSLYLFTRVGRAILALEVGGEFSADSQDQAVPGLTDLTAKMTPAMCAFTEAGCGDGSAEVLGPDGYGALHLGMTADEIEATGLATVQPFVDNFAACRPFTIEGWRDTQHPNISGQVHGFVSRKHGLAIIFAQPGMRTPEGIGVGSTVEEVRAAYGELSGSDAYTTRPVNGIRYFIFTDLAGKVTAFQIELADQDCVH